MDKVTREAESEPVELDLLRQLLREIPEEERDEAEREAVQALGRIYARHSDDLPDWLTTALGPGPGILGSAVFEHYTLSTAASEAVRREMRRKAQDHPRGIKGLAADVGLSVGTFRRFLGGDLLTPDTWDALVPHAKDCTHAPFELVGLGMVTETLPVRVREQCRAFIAHRLAGFLDAKGIAEPAWLTGETEWLA